MENSAVTYVTRIENVREVILHGAADLSFWRARLHMSGLFPYQEQGRALLWLTATDLRWSGLRFQEFTLSLAVSQVEDGSRQDGFYLVGAFNSSRLLTLAERTFFRTPYRRARVQVDNQLPAMLALHAGASTCLRASMTDVRPLLRSADELWEGTIFLPQDAAATNSPGRCFRARLGGYTETYPFLSDADTFELTPTPGHLVFQWLLQSDFRAQEWRLRANATHARSRTFTRSG